MKSKKRSKTRKRTRSQTKRRSKTRKTTRTSRALRTVPTVNAPPSPFSDVKTCEEIEVGDIGGFGNTQELESHERHCGREATQFCTICARNLCGNHYELLHRVHDTTSGHSTSQSLTGQ